MGQSVLATQNNNILSDFGLSTDISEFSQQKYPNSAGEAKSIIELVQDGADFEDKFPRPVQHFYDPINDQSLQHPLLNLAGGTNASPDWALEDSGDINGQDNSYKNAADAFYKALTLSTKTKRNQQWGILFESLGNVIHHIQDMAQPEHVRNDLHCGIFWGCGLPGAIVGIYDPSFFEQRSKTVFRNGILPSLVNYPSVTFPTAREFWTTRASDPVVTDRRGLADFTNRNFVSKDTNFEIKNGTPAPSSRYNLPIPSGTNLVDLATLDGDGVGICQRLNQNGPVDLPANSPCMVEFIENIVTDSYDPTQSGTNTRAASLSLFDQYLSVYNVNSILVEDGDAFHMMDVDRLITINEYNIDAAHTFLIPRAVAYSAGLIDHFFRGKIDMAPNPNGAGWVIKNLSNEDMEGTFTLYYDSYQDVNGQQVMLRATVPGASWPAIMIPPNSEVVVGDYTVPSGVISKTLIFSGRIGAENNVYTGKYLVSGWTGPILIEASVDTVINAPTIAMDGSGNSMLVYGAGVTSEQLRSIYYTPAGGWEDTIPIDIVKNSNIEHPLAMDANGNALLVYRSFDDSQNTFILWSRRYTPAGGWDSATLIDSFTNQLFNSPYINLVVSMNADGNAMLTYIMTEYLPVESRTIFDLWSRSFTPAGGWSGATQIESLSFPNETFGSRIQWASHDINASGDAAIVYQICDSCITEFPWLSRFYTPGGGWSGATQIDDIRINTLSVALDSAGNAMVTYQTWDATTLGWRLLWSRRYTPSGGWGAATLIDNNITGLPTFAMDASGNAIVNYSNSEGVLVVRYYATGIGWGGEFSPSQSNRVGTPVSMYMEDNGKAVILWRDSSDFLYSNHYTP